MPIYNYECQDCGEVLDARRSVDERERGPQCDCGAIMVRTFGTPRVWAPTRSY